MRSARRLSVRTFWSQASVSIENSFLKRMYRPVWTAFCTVRSLEVGTSPSWKRSPSQVASAKYSASPSLSQTGQSGETARYMNWWKPSW